MRNIHFRKVFETVENEGYSTGAIISYQKTPWMGETRTLNGEEAREKGYRIENTVVSYKCYLRIDLWICVLFFDWIHKV